jgi:hypothetical protein
MNTGVHHMSTTVHHMNSLYHDMNCGICYTRESAVPSHELKKILLYLIHHEANTTNAIPSQPHIRRAGAG